MTKAKQTTSDLPGIPVKWNADWNYEATVREVEVIINQIELGELELADVFQQFSTAVDRLQQCETFLNQQQQQVDLLIETLIDEPEAL